MGADLAFNGRSNNYWQVNVGGDNCIHEISSQGALTGQKVCPEFAQAQRGLAYDPKSDTFYSGSWSDSIIHQFKSNGELIRSINVNLNIAGLAFNSASGQLYVTHNADVVKGVFDVYVLDTNTDFLDIVGGFNIANEDDSLKLEGQAGLEIDCDGNLWAVDQTQQKVLGVATHVGGVCDWKTVPWLTLDGESTGIIAAGDDSELSLTLKASELVVGEHLVTLVVMNDTPYGAVNVPLTITVNDAVPGTLAFKETTTTVKNGSIVELAVSRTQGDDFAASVNYEVIASSAVSGEHFNLTNGVLNWLDKDAADKSISIETIDLDLDQNVKFTVRLSDVVGAMLNSTSKDSLVTITADEVGMVSVKTPSLSVNEEDGSAQVVLSRTDGSDRAVTVSYQVNHISTDDADLTDTSGVVTWADGDSEDKTISITINDDSDVEFNEAFNLVISAADKAIELGTAVAAVQVLNSDVKPVEKIKEKSGGSLGFFVIALLGVFSLRRRKFIR